MPKPFHVVIAGSLNIDLIASVERLPTAGETVSATGLVQRFGGKGANQAVAAARQGARVSMIGRVGNDDNGRAYRKRLQDEGINVNAVSFSPRALTGTALIAVDAEGENLIVVAPGANGDVRPSAIRAQAELIASAELALLQFEIPMPSVIETVRLANRFKVPVVLNPSPWQGGFPWGKFAVDTVIANALEVQAILGVEVKKWSACLDRAVQQALQVRGIERIIITQGSRPTVCFSPTGHFEIPALPVRPVDTVGAGDAFAGTYVAARAEGLEARRCICLANCAGALATLKRGAQESIPTRAATARAAARLS